LIIYPGYTGPVTWNSLPPVFKDVTTLHQPQKRAIH